VKPPIEPTELERFIRSAVPFVLIGLGLYLALYAASERLIARHAQRNRFFLVKTASSADYDHVILGSSHAEVFDYRDMNARLEEMTGSRILNLAIEGAGITVNRLVLDYFLAEHRTKAVVYVLDSFPFYSRAWNEDRLQDTGLFVRAPFDAALARLLLGDPLTWPVALDYVLGFSKINNPDRFAPDVFEEEATRFDRVYRPVAQIDQQRIAYLYPNEIDESALRDSPYLAELEDLIRSVQARNIRFVVVRPPIPQRMYRMLPNEAPFDTTLKAVLARHDVELYDFSSVNNDEQFFFDSDHLNQFGVLNFFEHHLKDVLTAERGATQGTLRRNLTIRHRERALPAHSIKALNTPSAPSL
jgi:hypothetical protein